jgi:hypothetical protein
MLDPGDGPLRRAGQQSLLPVGASMGYGIFGILILILVILAIIYFARRV